MNIVVLARAQNDASPTCIYVHEQAIQYRKLGNEVIELCTVPMIPFMKWLRPDRYERFKNYSGSKVIDGVKIIYVKKISVSNYVSQKYNGIFTFFSVLPKIKKLIKYNQIDILHAHMLEQEGYAAYLIKNKLGIPVVVTTHGTDCIKYFIPRPKNYLVKTVNGVDRLVAVSNKLKNIIESKTMVKADVIYNGTSVNNSMIQNAQNIAKIKYSVISVGTFLKRKNFDITINTFKYLKLKHPEAILTLIGDGPEEQYLKEIVKKNQLEDYVKFLGRLPNDKVIKEMMKHEIFLMPSENEGFGIVYLEAMQCGCIPVALREAGISDIIKHMENGVLVSKPSSKDIAMTVDSLFENKEKLNEIKNNSIYTSKQYTWRKNAERYLYMFESLMKEK